MINSVHKKELVTVAIVLAAVLVMLTGCIGADARGMSASAKKDFAASQLDAPEDIKAEAADGNITVTWAKVDGAVKYSVSGAGVHVVTTSTSYTFTALAPGSYDIRAIALAGPLSSRASTVTVKIGGGGAIESQSSDIPAPSETKNASTAGNKKAETTAKADKPKTTNGGSKTSKVDTGAGNSGTAADKGKAGNATDTGTGDSSGNPGNTGGDGGEAAPGPNAGKTWREPWTETIGHPAEYTEVYHPEVWEIVAYVEFYDGYIAPSSWTMVEIGAYMHDNRAAAGYWVKDKTVKVSEAWFEQTLAKAAWTETINHPGEWV
jgi:hypothetical protein